MNKAEKAGAELYTMESLAEIDSPIRRLSALSKLFVTLVYIIVTVSFGKYDISGLAVMAIFPIAGFLVSKIPLGLCFKRLRIVMPLVCAVGIINPFLDRDIVLYLGGVGISGGVISMVTLMLKGIFTLMMSFLFISVTPVDELCAGLRKIRFPKVLTILIMLTFRYISVLIEEVSVMSDAYHLRAPGQRGVAFRAWGPFLGQLIIRSMDRASELYDSMVLRGFSGEFTYTEEKQ